jgi:hypothetical protein
MGFGGSTLGLDKAESFLIYAFRRKMLKIMTPKTMTANPIVI